MADLSRECRVLDAAEAGEPVNAVLDDVARWKYRVTIQQHGRDMVALISAADLERLEYYDRQRAERYKVIEEIHARNADLDPEEAERDIAEAIAEVRAEARARAVAAPTT